jgi:hypothetical protein
VDDAVGGDVSWEGWLEGGRKGRGFGIGDRVDAAFEGCRAERGGRGEEWKGWAGGRRLGWEGRGRTRCGSFAEEFYEGLAVVGSAEERCCSHCGCGVDIKAEVRWALEVVQCSIAV